MMIMLVTCFGAACYSPGGEEYSDDPTFWNVYGNGSAVLARVAAQEVGNIGGEKYWRWYGFGSRVDWCACFVSWCADQCGYIDSGTAPKFASVTVGANWFRKKGQWAGKKYTPKPGDLIFIDWNSDGALDHVGIVESCDGKTVYTIEGNSADVCRRNTYAFGKSPIAGYGLLFTEPLRNARLLADKATELAYPDLPDEAKYNGGRPTPEYAAALERAYPNRSSWSAAPRVGASCDVFVGVCIVDSGIDKDFPRGYDEQAKRLDDRTDLYECIISTTTDDIDENLLQDGDIIRYDKNNGGCHICIYVGGKLKHASLASWYPRTTKPGKRIKIQGKKLIRVYRVK